MTADEMLNRARSAFNDAQWEEAAGFYTAFIQNFGRAEEVAELLPRINYDLTFCYLRLGDFSRALSTINETLAGTPKPSEAQIQELTFWRAICEMQEGRAGDAQESLNEFLAMFPEGAAANPTYRRQFPAAAKIPEAQLLIGTFYLMQEKNREAADYLAEMKEQMIPENRGRATVLELFGLLQANELERALAVVVEEYPRVGELTQLVAFQTLTLQLGAALLDQQQFRKAIITMQRIWDADRQLRHQERRLGELNSRLEALEANPRSDPYEQFRIKQTITKIKREIENFEQIENFDSALRLRLATAFQAMHRYREAALIMEEMLQRMPPDPIVESASVNLVQSWMEIERWPKVVAAARAFEEKFPKSENLPLILYMEGIALQNDNDYPGALAVFERILKDHAKSDFAARAQFMIGFTQLLAEDNPSAIAAFEEFPKKFKDHEMTEAAAYWRGMAYSLDGQYEKTRDVMDEYLAAYPDGVFVGAAKFRKAYAAQHLMDFDTSIAELNQFLGEHPGHENMSEALVLLGDAYMNEGEMEEGIAAFKRIPPHDTRFFEEGWFKVGRALKLMEEYETFREHMEEFVENHPRSPRVAEALFHIGWVHRQDGEDDKAREIYWNAIAEYGPDPTIRSVDDLFPALVRLYRAPEDQAQYLARLRDLREDAIARDQEILALRALWAQAYAMRRENPAGARELLVEAADLVDIQETNPLLMADIAEALLESDMSDEGEEMFREMVRWNPRAPQKDRAFAALGLLEMQRGNERAALRYFHRFENETLGSSLLGRVLLAKATLEEERGIYADAKATLENLLGSEYASGQEKAEALFRIGEIHMREGKPHLAIPYYQRVYIMHGRWRDWVAKAYLRSGEAFEELKDLDAARKTYQELSMREELHDFQEASEARERLDKLGAPSA